MWCKITRLFSHRRRKQAYDNTFKAPDGKIVLEDMFYRYRYHQPVDHTNPYWAAYQDGRKAVISDLLATLDKDVRDFSDSIPSKQEIEKGVTE